MNYLKLYIKICKRSSDRVKMPDQEYEAHHIFPVAVYGKNDMTVFLTTREHLVVHILLMKAFIKRYGQTALKTAQMSMAVHKMVYRLKQNLNCKITSRHYAIARKAARLSKIGKHRPDMKGKAFFGASECAILKGTQKMAIKKRGKPINYPKNRKSRTQLESTNEKISASRKETLVKYKNMSELSFQSWIGKQNLFTTDGRRNSNVTLAIIARNEDPIKYYSKK